MSGIAGIWYAQPTPLLTERLGAMSRALAHRGPDGAGTWQSSKTDGSPAGRIGLVHRLLHTTPESLRASSPTVHAESGCVLTGDVRLDNRDALRAQLDLAGAELSDLDLLVRAYLRWGVDCLDHLVGVFSFAIWDERAGRLFAARDHFGVKPFYYAWLPDRCFAFASEAGALLQLPEVPRTLDETRIADFLTQVHHDPEPTVFAHVKRLPAAHRLILQHGTLRLERYWSLPLGEELALKSDAEYAEAFRHYFSQAVERRLHSARTVGSMLSGGLDSTAIACTAQHLRGQGGTPASPMPTFSARFPDLPDVDEGAYIESALTKYPFTNHTIDTVRYDLLSPTLKTLEAKGIDTPVVAGNMHVNWYLYEQAREAGVRVMLDGFDGDTTVSHGNMYIKQLGYERRLFAMARVLHGLASRMEWSYGSMLRSHLYAFGLHPVLRRVPGYQGLRARWQRRKAGDAPAEAPPGHLLRGDLAERVGWTVRHRASHGRPPLRTAQLYQHRWLTQALMPLMLEFLDQVAAQFQIEIRYPFWDRDLITFCLSVPPTLKLRDGWGRYIMRIGLHGILPEAVQWRTGKSNLGPGFDIALRGPSQHHLDWLLAEGHAYVAPYVNLEALKTAYQRVQEGYVDGAEPLEVWTVALFARWLAHLENQDVHTGTIPADDVTIEALP